MLESVTKEMGKRRVQPKKLFRSGKIFHFSCMGCGKQRFCRSADYPGISFGAKAALRSFFLLPHRF